MHIGQLPTPVMNRTRAFLPDSSAAIRVSESWSAAATRVNSVWAKTSAWAAGIPSCFWRTLDTCSADLSLAYPAYEPIHGRRVLAAPSDSRYADSRLRLRNAPPPFPERLLASGARYVVVHRDLPGEEARVPALLRRLRPEQAAALRETSRRIIKRLRRAWGAPYWQDDAVVVWDLEQVRRTSGVNPLAERSRSRLPGAASASPAPPATP